MPLLLSTLSYWLALFVIVGVLIGVAVGRYPFLQMNRTTIVLVFTPLVLELCKGLKLKPLPYLIALATAANIGSTATITGNPQNMIIGVASKITFTRFVLALGPVALGGMVISWLVIMVV